MVFCSSFPLEVCKSDQRKNERRQLLSAPTNVDNRYMMNTEDYRLKGFTEILFGINQEGVGLKQISGDFQSFIISPFYLFHATFEL